MAVNATYCSANALLSSVWLDGIDSAYTVILGELSMQFYRAVLSVWSTGEI
jgi:hypothetical protein